MLTISSDVPENENKESINMSDMIQFFIRAVLLYNSHRGFSQIDLTFLTEPQKETKVKSFYFFIVRHER